MIVFTTLGLATLQATASTQPPSPIDIGFCQDMTVHHDQAILMSENVIARASPRVRTLAISILSGQSREAGMMRGWLAVWGAPQLPSTAPMTWMKLPSKNGGASNSRMPMSMPSHRGTAMPGMASQTELASLSTKSGKSLDVDFLQLMIRHHEGGIAMAAFAEQYSKNDLVRGAAAEMALDQTNETLLMRSMLAADGGSPLPMN